MTLVNGRATFATSSLTVGAHSVSAAYSGSTSSSASTGATLTQTVNKASSRTVVTNNGTPAARGTAVTFTATAVAPGAGVATGTVQFRIDGQNAGAPVALVNGQARYITSTMTAATHIAAAVYAGDSHFTTSTSTNISQRIQ